MLSETAPLHLDLHSDEFEKVIVVYKKIRIFIVKVKREKKAIAPTQMRFRHQRAASPQRSHR